MTDSPWLTVGLALSWKNDETPADPPAEVDRPALVTACNAVAEFVEDRRADLWDLTDPDAPVYRPTETVKLGAIMLALRYYERRGSTLGVAGFSPEFGPATILRWDPDIARMLGIERARRFRFGAPRDPDVEATP